MVLLKEKNSFYVQVNDGFDLLYTILSVLQTAQGAASAPDFAWGSERVAFEFASAAGYAFADAFAYEAAFACVASASAVAYASESAAFAVVTGYALWVAFALEPGTAWVLTESEVVKVAAFVAADALGKVAFGERVAPASGRPSEAAVALAFAESGFASEAASALASASASAVELAFEAAFGAATELASGAASALASGDGFGRECEAASGSEFAWRATGLGTVAAPSGLSPRCCSPRPLPRFPWRTLGCKSAAPSCKTRASLLSHHTSGTPLPTTQNTITLHSDTSLTR